MGVTARANAGSASVGNARLVSMNSGQEQPVTLSTIAGGGPPARQHTSGGETQTRCRAAHQCKHCRDAAIEFRLQSRAQVVNVARSDTCVHGEDTRGPPRHRERSMSDEALIATVSASVIDLAKGDPSS